MAPPEAHLEAEVVAPEEGVDLPRGQGGPLVAGVLRRHVVELGLGRTAVAGCRGVLHGLRT